MNKIWSWSVLTPSDGKHYIGCKTIVTHNSDRSIERYKVLLMANSFTSTYKIAQYFHLLLLSLIES